MTTAAELAERAHIAFPPPRDEAWKYTRAAWFLRQDWHAAAPVIHVEARGAEILPVEAAQGTAEGFVALNQLLGAGHRVVVADGAVAEVELARVAGGEGKLAAGRHRVEVGRGGKLRLVERFAGDGPGFTSAGLDVALAPGAELVHVRLVEEGPAVVHHGAIAVEVGEGARYELVSVVAGAATCRVEPTIRLAAPGASAELYGLLAFRGAEHGDHHVTMDHAAPRCTSRQVFRSLLDGRSRGVFTGRVIVRSGAAGTDAEQVHRALLLSDGAVANARPQLEIDADDVKCAHGTAVGSLDEEALFYLRQRGLDPSAARALLTAGFAGEIVARLPEGPLRDAIEARLAWAG